MKIVHAADLHIDSPLRGLQRLDDAPVATIRLATRRAFEGLIDLCLHEQAALLLLAGDVFDGDWKDFHTGLFFVRQLNRLQEVGTRVVFLRGNHDAASSVTRSLPQPAHVTELSTKAPQTRVFEDLGVAVHGQGYADRAVEDNLAAAYPPPLASLLNIGLLHTNATGSSEHANYAPCTVAQLVGHGYGYWALGHVHHRAVLAEDPWVVYPGNLQGRHARETGPKGCTVLEVDDGIIRAVRPVILDVVRWDRVAVDASGAADASELGRRLGEAAATAREEAGERPLLLRVELHGQTSLHPTLHGEPERTRAELAAAAFELGECWVEKIELQTTPPRQAASLPEALLGALEAELAAAATGAGSESFRALLEPLLSKAAAELPPELTGEDFLGQLLPRVEAVLRAELEQP